MNTETVKWISRIVTGSIALLLIIAFFDSYKVIKPGNSGIIFNKWSGSLRSVPQGLTWKIPFITDVQSYPTALRTYTMVKRGDEGSSRGDDSIDLPTKESQHIKQDLSITYNTSEDKAALVFKNFKGADIEDIESTFIRRTIMTIAQNAAGQMSLVEVTSSQRDKLQDLIQKNLAAELVKMGFTLDKVNLGASHLPEAIEKQMQEKMAAQQKALQADYQLQENITLAKAEAAKAEGEANATLIRAKAQAQSNRLLQESLSPAIIEYNKVLKWNGQNSQVVMGNSGAIPLINVTTK